MEEKPWIPGRRPQLVLGFFSSFLFAFACPWLGKGKRRKRERNVRALGWGLGRGLEAETLDIAFHRLEPTLAFGGFAR